MTTRDIWLSNEDDEDMANVREMLDVTQDAIRTAFSDTKRTLDDPSNESDVRQKVIKISKVNDDFKNNPVESLKANVATGLDRAGLELWAATGKAMEVVESLNKYEKVTSQLFENPYYAFISKIEGFIHKKDTHHVPGVIPGAANIPVVKKQPNAGITVQLDAANSVRINSTNNVSGIGAGGAALSNIKNGQFSAESLEKGGEDEYTRKVLGLADTTRVMGILKPSDAISIAIDLALGCLRNANYDKFVGKTEYAFFGSNDVMAMLVELVSNIYLKTDSFSKNSYTHDSYEPRRDKSIMKTCAKMDKELVWDTNNGNFRLATPYECKKNGADKLAKLKQALDEDYDDW